MAVGFPEHFRKHAFPVLLDECDRQGLAIAAQSSDWDEAFRAILTRARTLGAGHLHDDLVDDLHDALTTWLSAAVLKHDTSIRNHEGLCRKTSDRVERYVWAFVRAVQKERARRGGTA